MEAASDLRRVAFSRVVLLRADFLGVYTLMVLSSPSSSFIDVPPRPMEFRNAVFLLVFDEVLNVDVSAG